MRKTLILTIMITLWAGSLLAMSPQSSEAQECQSWFFTFQSNYQDNRCADEVIVTNAEGADFEGGRAYWYDSSPNFGAPLIYVIYNDHTWAVYSVTTGSAPQNINVPANRYVPTGPIGVLWNNNPTVRQNLGWAYEPVTRFTGRRQLPLTPVGQRFEFYIDHGTRNLVLRLRQDFSTGEQTWVAAGEYKELVTVPPVYNNTAIGTLTPDYAYEINVRTGPGLNYDILDIIDWRDTVPLIEVGADWHKIDFNGQVAYVTALYTQYELYPAPVPVSDVNFIHGMAFTMVEDDTFAAIGVDITTTESIALMGDRSGYNIQNLRGGVWITSRGDAVTMFIDQRGFPSLMQIGAETYIFTNYQGISVNVTVIRNNGSIMRFDRVPINSTFYVEIANLLLGTSEVNQFARASVADQTPAMDSFKIFGWGLSGVVCELTTYAPMQTAGLTIASSGVNCGGFVSKITNLYWRQTQADLLDDGSRLLQTQTCMAAQINNSRADASQGDATAAVQQAFANDCISTVVGASEILINRVESQHAQRATQIESVQ